MPFFSVIIPLYNKENFIENTVNSVLNQTFTDYEIIIVNDGSTDESENRIHQFSDARIRFVSQENQGVSVARNHGISLAKAHFISFLDADDYWYPDFLKVMHQRIQQFPEQKIFAAAIEVETGSAVFRPQYSIERTGEWEIVNYFESSLKESVIFTSCAAFHRRIFDEIGAFDPSVKSGQDMDLWIRMGLTYPVVFSWKILARYIYDAKSLSRDVKFANKKMNFAKFKELEKDDPDLKKFLDLNRFSLAIKSKLIGDPEAFKVFYQDIDLKKLPAKKRFLLQLPAFALRKLIDLKSFLANAGLGNSVFK